MKNARFLIRDLESVHDALAIWLPCNDRLGSRAEWA